MFCCFKSKKKGLEASTTRSHPYLVTHQAEDPPIKAVASNKPPKSPHHLLKPPFENINSKRGPVKPEDYFKVSEDLYAESEKEKLNNNTTKWLKIMKTLSSPKYKGEFKRYFANP